MGIFAVAFKWITSNIRLFIEYLLLWMLVSLAGLCLTMWFRNTGLQKSVEAITTEMNELQLQLTVRQEVMEQQANVMDQLLVLRSVDSDFLQSLSTNLQHNDTLSREWFLNYSALEKDHETAKPFLDTPVPVGVRCLLDGACQADHPDQD